jgi:hypothetical protein
MAFVAAVDPVVIASNRDCEILANVDGWPW